MILGGGYTGMWTAWFLKELDPGIDVVLLEQDICGGGPSGRNGGFVNSFWGELTRLCERFGDEAALRVCRAGEQSVSEIGAFCERNYGVSFPMFEKVDVNGDDAHPLFAWLREEKGGILGDKIKWNFTKFLVGKNGEIVQRFEPGVTPEKIAPVIEAELKK